MQFFGAQLAVVILDDTEMVWPKHGANLVVMERCNFFRSFCRQFCVSGFSLTEKGRDESDKEGALAMALKKLCLIHQAVFSAANPVIQSLKVRVLNGCQVVFSGIFPTDQADPEGHAFGQLTAELGAHCSAVTKSSTMHDIALDRETDKSKWAKQNGKFLVHPCWVDAAKYLWCRPREEDFPVRDGEDSLPPFTYFAKTVPEILQSKPETTMGL